MVVLQQVGLGIGELWNFELVGVIEKHCWSCDCVEIALRDLVHFLQFADVSHEDWHVGWDYR